MSDFKEDYLLSRQEYGALFPYISKDDVKQVYWNGRSLSIDSEQGKSIEKERLSDGFTERFSLLICNRLGKSFNMENPVFEYENKTVFIQMIHESVAGAGTTLLIRKKERPMRPDAKSLVESGFCDEEVIGLLKNIIHEKLSFLIYGIGDTVSLMRFMTRYIPPESRMLCIEGEKCLDIASLNPDKDVTEIGIEPEYMDNKVIRICKGIQPGWILSDNADGRVVMSIVKAMDTYDVKGGLCVYRPDEDEMISGMFSWEDEKKLVGIKRTMYRVFPIRIGVDAAGVYQIDHFNKSKKELLYERSFA